VPKLALAFDVTANTSQASRKLDQLGNKVESTGKRVRGLTGTVGRPLLALAGAGGVGALIGSSVKLAASFDTTMRQIAVATNTTAAPEIKKLSDLALKMGAQTTFSAKQAGDAMLELAKGGLSAAQIKAGALSSTLTLAAAGGLDLGEAAGFVVQGLSTFNLKADKAGEVAAALAGGANASTASVQDMGLALAQVGPGALNAGLSLQETTAVLAEFAQNGIKGSDAGTSLKTMLTRLVPTTKQAKGEMKKLGLSFVDAHGQFKSISDIAQQLHDKLGPLSDATRTAALSTIFGSDASRAATVLAKEGTKGLAKYIKATNDQSQAQKLAKAATSGTAGALEQMHGSIETAQIALGTALAPAVTDIAKKISNFASGPLTKDVIPAISKFVQGMEDGKGSGGKFADALGDVGDATKQAWAVAKPMLSFVGDHPKLFTEVAKDALIFAGAMKTIGAVKKLPGLGTLLGGRAAGRGGILGAVTKAAPLPVFVTNHGFGGGGLPTILGGGKASEVGKLGKLGKLGGLAVAAAGGPALIATIANIELDPRAIRSLKKDFDFSFNLSVNDAAKKFLKQLEDPQTDRVTRGVLKKHAEAVYAGVAEAARSGDTKLLQQALKETYADLHHSASAIQRQMSKDTATSVAKNISLISGGFITAQQVAKSTSDKMGRALGDGVRVGVRSAGDRLDLLERDLDRVGAKKPTPKVDLNSKAAVAKNNELLRKLHFLDGFQASPNVKLRGADSATKKMRDLIRLLTTIPDASVTVSVPDLISGGFSTKKPTGASATGGWISGPGTGTSDSIPWRVSNGEFVVNSRDAKRNASTLEAINSGKTPALASVGGPTVNFYGGINVADRQSALSVVDQMRQSMWLKGLT
jgi:TP901 family phage tail tape measure protein